jgi:hypothetical protein
MAQCGREVAVLQYYRTLWKSAPWNLLEICPTECQENLFLRRYLTRGTSKKKKTKGGGGVLGNSQ